MIKKAHFITSAASQASWPNHSYPEVVVLGRSNSGKSTFINALTGQKKLAKTSSVPGKTQLLNFFDINQHKVVLVDSPGYGFSKLSRHQRQGFAPLMNDYLLKRKNFRGAILLLDSRHPPTPDDQQLYNFLRSINKPVLVVGTKLDKLKKNDYGKQEKMLKQHIGLHPQDTLLIVSSVKKINLDQVYKILMELSERE